MIELNKLIEQYKRETGKLPKPNYMTSYDEEFVLWLASRPTCGKEQKLIEAVKEEKKQIALSYQNDEIDRAYFDGRDDQCNTFLKLIEEILP